MKTADEIFKNTMYGDFQQSDSWANVKNLWERVVINYKDDEDVILASMSILVRKIPIFGYFMYVPRGPIGEYESLDVMSFFKNALDELNKKYHAFAVVIEPNIKNEDEAFKKTVKESGFKINNNAMNFSEAIQARHNFRINLKDKTEEEVFNNFTSKTRYNIRLAKKKGVIIKKIGIDGLNDFYKLMEITGKRDNFGIRKKEYFKKIMTSFKDNASIYTAYYNDTPLASALMINYGKTTTYLYGASSNEERNKMPTYLLQWTMIKDAIKEGMFTYDFRGVKMDEGENGGLYRFKKGFGGELIELIGEIYIPYHPLKYRIFKLARKVLCKIRHIKLILKNFLQSSKNIKK